jgi:hypothetical protein
MPETSARAYARPPPDRVPKAPAASNFPPRAYRPTLCPRLRRPPPACVQPQSEARTLCTRRSGTLKQKLPALCPDLPHRVHQVVAGVENP